MSIDTANQRTLQEKPYQPKKESEQHGIPLILRQALTTPSIIPESAVFPQECRELSLKVRTDNCSILRRIIESITATIGTSLRIAAPRILVAKE
jgi:metal-dependent amidase/aminoacylase/carboxypeptidase family protein